MSNEPSQFRRGKAFHKLIQKEWEQEAEGDVKSERHVRKPNGRKGRVDVFVNDEDPKGPIAIVEVKATDLDKIEKKNICHNVRCQIRQIWSYIESQILNGQYVKGGEGKDICSGIIFPNRVHTTAAPTRTESQEPLGRPTVSLYLCKGKRHFATVCETVQNVTHYPQGESNPLSQISKVLKIKSLRKKQILSCPLAWTKLCRNTPN